MGDMGGLEIQEPPFASNKDKKIPVFCQSRSQGGRPRSQGGHPIMLLSRKKWAVINRSKFKGIKISDFLGITYH